MTPDSTHWQQRLEDLLSKHTVAGAALGILKDGELVTLAAGKANIAEDIDALPSTLFQIGSISKVWTATIVMQLVDEGKVSLDEPVSSYLPGLVLADASVTIRQLLTHTSGIDGDHMLDTGRGDDNLALYAASLTDVAQTYLPGKAFSYCNAGYSLLGRLVEVLDGGTWDASLRQRLFTPLGLERSVTLPEEALRFRTATGHMKPAPDVPLAGTPMWGIHRSAGPAGLITQQVADLLAFAAMHLAGGVTGDGTRVLSEESAKAMLVPQVDCPDPWLLGQHWGLGWILSEWGGELVYGHDGTTLGQNAYLRVAPGGSLAVAVLTNGGGAADLAHDVLSEVFAALAGLEKPARPEPVPDLAFDRDAFLGTFERASVRIRVLAEGDGLALEMTSTSPLAAALGADAPQVLPLLPFQEGVFLAQMPGTSMVMPVISFEVDGTRFLHLGARSTPEVSA
jgi:CubicO group peptidase (beta-lactamase class C family)